jgi:hypothetical protein
VLFIRWRVGAERRGESWSGGPGRRADFFLVFDVGAGSELWGRLGHDRIETAWLGTDLERRGVIEKLLLEEEAKLKKYDEDHKKK